MSFSQTGKAASKSDLLLELLSENNQLYLILSTTCLNRDILVISKFREKLKDARWSSIKDGGYPGILMNELCIRFTKASDTSISVHMLDLVANPQSASVGRKAISTKTSLHSRSYAPGKILVNISPIANPAKDLIFMNTSRKRSLNIPLESRGISIVKTQSDSNNLEIISEIRFPTQIVKLSTSFYLLPTTPVTAQAWDPRVGYFVQNPIVYQQDDWWYAGKKVIKRWNLAPDKKHANARSATHLPEPEHPIVYYIDSSVPKEMVSYVINGVNAWNKVFEKIGLKNIISACPYPVDDTSFSPSGIRKSVIYYINSDAKDATYQLVTDPRSGEIIQSNIYWSSNMLIKIKKWCYALMPLYDTDVNNFHFSDSLIGYIMTYVMSHEVGHSLGLDHNFQASAFASIKSLKDPKWVKENGISSSIMDYCRINYIIEENYGTCKVNDLIGRIGPYDHWAIEWGYSSLIDENKFASQNSLASLVKQKITDPAYQYGGLEESSDPRNQMEDISNNSLESTKYGLATLLTRAANFNKKIDSLKDLKLAKEIYQELYTRYILFCNHVARNIGGRYMDWKSAIEPIQIYKPVPVNIQKSSIDFITGNFLIAPPLALLDSITLAKLNLNRPAMIDKISTLVLEAYISDQKLQNLKKVQKNNKNVDLLHYYLQAARLSVFDEFYNLKEVNKDKSILQQLYIEKLKKLAKTDSSIAGIVKQELLSIENQIEHYSKRRGITDQSNKAQ